MTTPPDEILTDDALIRRVIAAQAPHWAALPLRRVASPGTDNVIFRLGPRLALRIPRRRSAIPLLEKELDWLPHLQGLPLDVPVLRYRGQPDPGPVFGIFNWIDGQIATPAQIADWAGAADALADFLQALHLRDTAGAPRAGAGNHSRGVPLRALDAETQAAITAIADEVDARRSRSLWAAACAAEGPQAPVWLHGDLKADNLIARSGRLRAVIDWGLAAVGDPAADYAVAWSWVDPAVRSGFRTRLGIPEADWLRARGWALYGAVIALSFYRGGGNPALCAQSRLTLSRLGLLL